MCYKTNSVLRHLVEWCGHVSPNHPLRAVKPSLTFSQFSWLASFGPRALAWSCAAACFFVLSASIPAQRADDYQAAQDGNLGSVDPSDVFLKAYTSVQQGEKLEGDGKLRPALAKYRYAASLLEQLNQTNPNWQPLIIQYRIRKTTENIRKLEDKLALQPPTEPTAPVGARSGAAANVPPAEEDDLPVPDAPNGYPAQPTAAPVPPVAELSSATIASAAKLAKMAGELKAAQDALAAAKKKEQDAIKRMQELEFQQHSLQSNNKIVDTRLKRFKAERDDLQKDLDKAQARLKEALVKNPDATEARKELRDQVATLTKSLAKAEADTAAAQKERDNVGAKLTEAESRNNQLAAERDKALAQNVTTEEASRKIQALQTENEALNKQLTAAEASIAQLTTEAVKKKEELEGMQKELTTVKDQLATTRDQQDRSATTITELNQKLEEDGRQLAEAKRKGMTGEEYARMTNENNLLKGIVLRQLKVDANRALARKLVSDELARLEVQSSVLNDQIEQLGRPTVPLTDEERALFKEPETAASTPDPSLLASKITAYKPSASASPATSAEPAAAPPGETPAAAPVDGTAQANPPSDPADGAPQVETKTQPQVAEELQPLARQAEESFHRGKFGDSEEAYKKLLARDPKNIYLLSNMGAVLSRENKLKSAEVTLKKAMLVNGKDAYTLATLGIVYYRMRRYDDALECLTKAVQYDPKNATAHNYLGITSSQKGWPEAALEEVQKAISLNPQYADAHFNIAVIYATNQPPAKEQAQEHYKMATSLGAAPDPALEKLIGKK